MPVQVINPSLQTLFNNYIAGTGGLIEYDLYTITLFGGGVLRFTTADFDILAASSDPNVNGFLYPSSGVRVDMENSKTQAHLKVGFDVDTWIVVFIPRPFDAVTRAPFPDKIGNVPWIQAAHSGALDQASVQVDRAYFSTTPTWPMPPTGQPPVWSRTIFAGFVAQCDTNDTMVVLTLNDYRDFLAIQMPRQFYQAQCRHTLFDAACNADGNMAQAAFGVPGLVGAGSTQSVILAPGLTAPRGSRTYAQGAIQIQSGLNATFWRTIKSWDGLNTLNMLIPFPFAFSAGDVFTAFPGCDKTETTCQNFQGNISNFGGFRFIPNPEVSV